MPDTTDSGTGATPTPTNPTPAGESLSDGGRKALRAEREKNRQLEQRLKELEPVAAKAKEREDADKSEVQRLTEQLAEADKARQAAELRAMRLEVAHDAGLTPAQAKRLSGDDLESLKADAADLMEAFGGKSTTPGTRKPQEDTRVISTDDDAPVEETDPGKLADKVMSQAF